MEFSMKAFFWSDLNFADDETCYLDQCENDPCNGRGCKSTWDGKKAGFICERKCKIDLLTRFYINSYILFFTFLLFALFLINVTYKNSIENHTSTCMGKIDFRYLGKCHIFRRTLWVFILNHSVSWTMFHGPCQGLPDSFL